jgi:hypothetical protein
VHPGSEARFLFGLANGGDPSRSAKEHKRARLARQSRVIHACSFREVAERRGGGGERRRAVERALDDTDRSELVDHGPELRTDITSRIHRGPQEELGQGGEACGRVRG